MKMTFRFVPPGGGEVDHSMPFDLPCIPHAGDYVLIQRPGEIGTEDYRVRRTWWKLSMPQERQATASEAFEQFKTGISAIEEEANKSDDEETNGNWKEEPLLQGPAVPETDVTIGKLESLYVECEFAIGNSSTESHKRACENYSVRKATPLEFDESMY